jgi:PAS domain S-box-containing protein
MSNAPKTIPDVLPPEPRAGVLLVDDQPANLLALETILGDLGLDLVRATSGDEALRQLLDQDFAVILLDVRMPGMDGFETARLVRGRNRSRHTPIIFLTAGKHDWPSVEKAYSLGGVDFLTKPLVPLILRAKVAGFADLFIEKKRTERQADQLRLLIQATTDYAIFMLNPEGRVVTWNTGAELIKGYKADEIIGQHFSRFYPSEAVERGWPDHELVRATADGRFEDEGWRVRKDGTMFWANVVITALRDQVGRLRGFSKVTRDLTERRRREEELRALHRDLEQRVEERTAALAASNAALHAENDERRRAEAAAWTSEARKAAVLDTSLDGIVAIDHNGRVIEFNPGAERMFGHRQADVIGREMADLIIPLPLRDAHRQGMANHLSTGDGQVLGRRIELPALRADGTQFLVELAVTRMPSDGEAIFIGFVRDITDRKRAEELLVRQAEALREADRKKDEFLATLAHELRNPLAPLRNGLQIMRLLPRNPAALEQAWGMMDRQLTQLVRLVDDLLDVSRITRGKLNLRREGVDVRAVIAAAVETSRPAIEQAGHELTVKVPEEAVLVDGDATRLAQVVANLLNNSAKYTHRGGHICLTAERTNGSVVLSVKDNGIGIPPTMLGRVFEMFIQVDRTLEKTTGGLGIGLSLVKGLVEMHGGTIEARSEGEGKGSEFVVTLPVAIPKANDPDHRTTDVNGAVQPDRRRVLVVDDNVDAADSLGQLLELLGNEIRTAHNGEAGIAAAAAFRPDVILMDIGMPKLNGYEAARRVREQPWGRTVVLVALTGWGQEADRRKSADAGFDFHLVKPVDPAALKKLLAGLEPVGRHP